MTISYQKINLVVFVLLTINNDADKWAAAQVGQQQFTSSAAAAVAPPAIACPVQYAPADKLSYPLLFGGVEDACVSGCQPRDGSIWWV